MIRVDIAATRSGVDHWDLTATAVDAEGREVDTLARRRLIRLAPEEGYGFPLPPREEAERLTGPERELCAEERIAPLRGAFAALAAGSPPPGAVPTFGAYLFAVLIGRDLWKKILELTNAVQVELALRWPVGEAELNRLPWEMMRGPHGYLVRENKPEVAITRVVLPEDPDDDSAEHEPAISPRVLFVVGADTTDKDIRWGAEYLGMLRHLERSEGGLISKLLVNASPQDADDAIAAFTPSVVHYTCHGRIDDVSGTASLIMRSDEDPERVKEQAVTAQQLATRIAAADPSPPIVVLNACHTGQQYPASEISAPMSAALVRAGVPVVIGMWGRVADSVCRLFTRRFYEALLDGEPIIVATARGRREGFTSGDDPDLRADWGFPAVFLSHRVNSRLSSSEAERDAARRTERIARSFRAHNDPPVFCDRFDVFRKARHMLEATDSHPILVVRELEREEEDDRYGKTRLLEELAVQAYRENVVPCLVSPQTRDLPLTAAELARLTLRCLALTFQRVELDAAPTVIATVLRQPEEAWPEDIVESAQLYGPIRPTDDGGPPDRALALAIRADLERLGQDAGMEVMLLLDEVHRYGPGALSLVTELLEPEVLVSAGKRIPLVVAYGPHADYPPRFQALKEELAQRRPRAAEMTVDLQPFPQPLEDPLPYRQYLLLGGWRRYVIAMDEDAGETRLFLRQLYERTHGVPSRLSSTHHEHRKLHAFVEGWAEEMPHVIQPATDDDEAALRYGGPR